MALSNTARQTLEWFRQRMKRLPSEPLQAIQGQLIFADGLHTNLLSLLDRDNAGSAELIDEATALGAVLHNVSNNQCIEDVKNVHERLARIQGLLLKAAGRPPSSRPKLLFARSRADLVTAAAESAVDRSTKQRFFRGRAVRGGLAAGSKPRSASRSTSRST